MLEDFTSVNTSLASRIVEDFNHSVIMQEFCRDRYGSFPAVIFKLFSCSMCYSYLFHIDASLEPDKEKPWNLVPMNGTLKYHENFTVLADITNLTARALVCQDLSDDDCDRWSECCVAATACCDRQVSQPVLNVTEGLYCPRTWDGYACVDDTPASTRTYISCPGYVDHASTSGKQSHVHIWDVICQIMSLGGTPSVKQYK